MPNHAEVAHRWAQGVYRKEGEPWPRQISGYNVFFEGPSIYSHGRHFEIARIVRPPNGRPLVLFTTRGYSNSTGKHKYHVLAAIPDFVQVVAVDSFDDIDVAIKSLVVAAATLHAKAGRAIVHVQRNLDAAERKLDDAVALAAAYNIEFTRPALADLSHIVQERAAVEAAAREALREEERLLDEARRKRDLEDFNLWHTGGATRLPTSYRETPTGAAYLRRSPDGERLETSQGAQVPWEEALRVFRFVKLVRERQQPWRRNSHHIHVGFYQVDEIKVSGDFAAGCHKVEWDEVKRLACREGVFDVEPSDAALS